MQQTLFNLQGKTTIRTAGVVIEEITSKLQKQIQVDELEVPSWTNTTDTYHAVTKNTKQTFLLTVEKDGTLYAKFVATENEIVVGRLY